MSAAPSLSQVRLWATPAPLGARLAAFTIDTLAVLALGAALAAVTRSVAVTIIAAVQAAALIVIVEARTGATLGNLLLGLRTTRDDAPHSLGLGRAAIRAAVHGAGFAAGGIGAWVLLATGRSDPQRLGRSWADRAGRALVVKVPRREELTRLSEWLIDNHPGADLDAGDPAGGAGGQPPAEPAPPRRTRPVAPAGSGAHAQAHAGTLDSPLLPPQTPAQLPRSGPQVLLAFDTGQRERFAIPAAITLGRRPQQHTPEDVALAVHDPDRSVSKTHLRIECRAENIWLTDLGSTNGSEIFDDAGASVLLEAGSRVRLDDGARVRIGNRSFTIAAVADDEA